MIEFIFKLFIVALHSVIVMLLWNTLVLGVFSGLGIPSIKFWEAMYLFWLCQLLFRDDPFSIFREKK